MALKMLHVLNIVNTLSFQEASTYLPFAHDFWMARGGADLSDEGQRRLDRTKALVPEGSSGHSSAKEDSREAAMV